MAAVVPTVLDFGAEPFQDGNGFKATVRKEAMGRQVLGQVTNLDLNLSRAGKTFAPGAQVERDQAQAAEDFSQVKFTYLELSAKHDFIRILTMDGLDKVDPKVEAEQEQMLQDGKDGLKSLKERSKKLKIEVEDQLRDACRKYEQLQAEAEQFRALIQSGNYAEQEVAATRLAELDTATLQQQEVIKKQEESIRILSDERKELSMAVRGLDAEVIELSERAHPSIEDIQVRCRRHVLPWKNEFRDADWDSRRITGPRLGSIMQTLCFPRSVEYRMSWSRSLR